MGLTYSEVQEGLIIKASECSLFAPSYSLHKVSAYSLHLFTSVGERAPGHFYLTKPDVTLSQVGVNSVILDQLLQVTFTSYGTLAYSACQI